MLLNVKNPIFLTKYTIYGKNIIMQNGLLESGKQIFLTITLNKMNIFRFDSKNYFF